MYTYVYNHGRTRDFDDSQWKTREARESPTRAQTQTQSKHLIRAVSTAGRHQSGPFFLLHLAEAWMGLSLWNPSGASVGLPFRVGSEAINYVNGIWKRRRTRGATAITRLEFFVWQKRGSRVAPLPRLPMWPPRGVH